MTTELKQALEVIKKHCDTPKGKSFYEYMDNASLKNRIENLKGNFLRYVDNETIWYAHTQLEKKHPNYWLDTIHPNYKKVELTKKQRNDSIQALKWFKSDIEACIAHLEEN